MSPLIYQVLSIIIALFLAVDSNPVPTLLVTETQTEEIIEYVTETEDETVTRQPWRHELRTDRGDLLAREIVTAKPWRQELRTHRGNLFGRDDDIATTAETGLEAETTDFVTEIVLEEITELNRDKSTAGFTPAPIQATSKSVLQTREIVESEESDSVGSTTQTMQEIVEKQNATAEPDTATTIVWQTEVQDDEEQDSVESTTTEQVQETVQKETSTDAPVEQVATTELYQTELATELVEVTAVDVVDITESVNETEAVTDITEKPVTEKPDTGGIVIDVDIIIDGQDPGPGYTLNGNGDMNGGNGNTDNGRGYNGQYFAYGGAGGPIQVYVHVEPHQSGN